jgi:hypothetical protein
MNGIFPFALEGETSEDIEARQGGNIFNLEGVEDISKQSRRARAVLSSQPDTKAILLISDEMSVAVNKYMTLIQRHNTQPGSVPRSNIVAALAEVRDNHIKLENAIREHLANLQVAQ